MTGPLDPQPRDQGVLGTRIIGSTQECFQFLDAQKLLVLERGGQRISCEKLTEGCQLVLHALRRDFFSGRGRAMLSDEADLARRAEIPEYVARFVIDQPWPVINHVALAWQIANGYLPPPSAISLTAWPGFTRGRPDGAWVSDDNVILTPLVLSAVMPGLAEIMLDAFPWEVHPTPRTWKKRLATRLTGGGSAPAETALGAAAALLQEHANNRKLLVNTALEGCPGMGSSTPMIADTWRCGPPDPETGVLSSERLAPADVPGLVSTATALGLTAIMATMVGQVGNNVGSLASAPNVFIDDGLRRLKSADAVERVLSLEEPFDELFDEIRLPELIARDIVVPAGVRHLTAPGNLVIAGTPSAMLLRMRRGQEPMLFAHNISDTLRGRAALVTGVEAMVSLGLHPATSRCLNRSFESMGAPFTVRGASNGARFGMFGLGAYFNQLLIGAVRTPSVQA
jgi:hypothetical protein